MNFLRDFHHVGIAIAGIEAEAVMMGLPMSMVLPKVVGYKLYGEVSQYATSTDVVLTITKVNELVQFVFVNDGI